VSGKISAADVRGPEAQGLDDGAFDGLLDTMDKDTVYVDISTTEHPEGEVCGQVNVEK
jgi:ketosteroid isomerase-like protein